MSTTAFTAITPLEKEFFRKNVKPVLHIKIDSFLQFIARRSRFISFVITHKLYGYLSLNFDRLTKCSPLRFSPLKATKEYTAVYQITQYRVPEKGNTGAVSG